jgi:hypothetical protein
MLKTPFYYEERLTDDDLKKIGQLSLLWSHTEHIIGNCLKIMLRLTDEEAIVAVFPLSLEQRINKIEKLARINPLNEQAKAAFNEFKAVRKAIQYVRNNVIHAIIIRGEGAGQPDMFHLRSHGRSLTKEQVFSAEELTNYAGHAALAFRYALGDKDHPLGLSYTLPERPEIPEFLRKLVQRRWWPCGRAGSLMSGSRGGRWSNVPARWNSACGPTRTCRQGRRLGVKTAGGAPAARLGNARS